MPKSRRTLTSGNGSRLTVAGVHENRDHATVGFSNRQDLSCLVRTRTVHRCALSAGGGGSRSAVRVRLAEPNAEVIESVMTDSTEVGPN
jgi:hypothetical protein